MGTATDIHPVKSEERTNHCERAFEHSPHLVFAVDSNFCCIYANEIALKAAGFSFIKNAPIKDFEPFANFILPTFEKILKGENHRIEEFEIHFSGRSRWFESHAHKLVGDNGEITGAVAILQDVTDRKRRELELNELKNKLEAQMKALDAFDIVAETDRRGRITYVNDQFIAISKYPREELIGQDHRLINSGFHPKAFFRDMWATISHGKLWSGEVRNRAKDGTIYWVSTVITPILDSAGKIKSFLAIRRDITKQKEAEEAIKDSELRYRELLESVNLIAVGLDLRGRMTFANSAFLKFVGKSREEILGKDWFNDFISGPSHDHIFEIFSKTLTDDEVSEHYECELSNSFTEKRLIRWKNTVFRDAKSDIAGVTVLGEDITEQRLSENKINELREKNERQREEIMGFVSHELRSPVNSIVVSVEMLKNRLKGQGYGADLPPEQALDQIYQQAQKILRVSKDFMEVSANRSEQMQFEFKPTHLNKLLKAVCTSFAEQLILKPTLKIQHFPSDIEIIGSWDVGRLDQVFTNLISNAIKYSKEDGGTIQIRSFIENEMAHIVVSDQGVGIPEGSLKNLFQSFSRAENVRNSATPGFGLGLKISKDIVEKHGGKIWAESQLNEGSQFHILLPLKK